MPSLILAFFATFCSKLWRLWKQASCGPGPASGPFGSHLENSHSSSPHHVSGHPYILHFLVRPFLPTEHVVVQRSCQLDLQFLSESQGNALQREQRDRRVLRIKQAIQRGTAGLHHMG